MPYKDINKQKEYYKMINSTDKRKKAKRKYREQHREHAAAKTREWYVNNKDRAKWQKILWHYNLTQDQYMNIWKSQNGICPICEQPLDLMMTVVDHDHDTHLIRGLLHRACNLMLGHFEPYIDKIENIKHYLNIGEQICVE